MVNTAMTVRRRLAPGQPASLVVFDVLAVDGVDVRPMRWTARRKRLESLAEVWQPPLHLSPVTADIAEAREWLEASRPPVARAWWAGERQPGICRVAGTGSR
jgi:ATP-dependent DNA ligase